MRHLVDAVRTSVKAGENYSALALALALPDICGKIADPVSGSQKRYREWFNAWMAQKYVLPVAGAPHTFLTGDDLYALRCAYLHEGDFDTSQQRASNILKRFVFVIPARGSTIHLNSGGGALNLQLDTFFDLAFFTADHPQRIPLSFFRHRLGDILSLNLLRK